jgi:hypothetical protein
VRTFLQLLRIAFWMLPLQRALTVIGALVLVAGQVFDLPFNMPGSTLPLTFFGVSLMMVVPLLAGGVFLRMLSASRPLLLRPHARGRLLAGTICILMLVTLFWVGCYWMAFLAVPPQYQPDMHDYLLMLAMSLSFGTQCAVSLFIASRSPLWTLLILLAWQLPALLLHLFGVDDAARLLGGPVSLGMSGMVWLVFGIWYLRARRIHATAWGRKEESTPAAKVVDNVAAVSHDQAMARWVLGGSTPVRIGLQCLLAAAGVLALQWIFARDSGERALQAMMFGTLAIVATVGGVVSSTMAAHARGLWLPAGRSRLQLHAWMEWRMLRVMLAIFAAVALVGALLWRFTGFAMSLPPAYLFSALLAPGLAAAWLGLMQQHRRSLFDALAGLAIFAGWFYGLVQPLYTASSDARWDILAAQLGLAVLLREVAYVRWRSADWRRVQRV